MLDEGDWHILDMLSDMPTKSYGIIAMTATDVGSERGNEKRRLNQLKFIVHDSKITPSFDADMPLDNLDVEDFLDRLRSNRARLIWCMDSQVQELHVRAVKMDYTVLVNHRVISDLRNLREDHCLLVTQLDLMRGVDYHAPGGLGIDLLIATDFPSTRAY